MIRLGSAKVIYISTPRFPVGYVTVTHLYDLMGSETRDAENTDGSREVRQSGQIRAARDTPSWM